MVFTDESAFLESIIDPILLRGGKLEPELYYTWQGERLDYLCYTNEWYKTCTMQKPMLKQSIEEEIEMNIQENIEYCRMSREKIIVRLHPSGTC